jgi:hypothetical protein
MQSVETQSKFRKNMLLPSSWSKTNPSKKPDEAGSKQSKQRVEISDYMGNRREVLGPLQSHENQLTFPIPRYQLRPFQALIRPETEAF